MLLKNKESGYSLLEVSVALGIAATISIPATGYAASDFPNVETETLASSGNVFSDLEDVSLIDPNVGEVIVFNGVEWVNQKMNLNFLGDVQLAIIPSEGDVVVFDGNNWVNQSTPASTLANLSNVELDGLDSGESLIWDGVKWVNGVGGMPGEILIWNGSTSNTPAGWLVADGSAVSRSTYSALFAEIGLTYGAGNGSTTFNLPDFSGRAGMGLDSSQTEFNTLGETGGQKTVTLTETQMPSHTHTQNPHGHTGTADSGGTHGHTGTADSGGTHGHAGTWSDSVPHTHTWPSFRQDSGRGGGGRTYATGNTSTIRSSSSGNHTHSVSSVSSSGTHTHDVTVTNAPSHTHDVTVSNSTAVNQTTGGGEAHDNLTPYVTVNYIIKY